VRFLIEKIKPSRGFGHAFHISFLAVLPLVLLILVRLEFNLIALAVLLLSKWRMLAVHPRHWIAHLRTNAVDIIVGLSFLTFMIASSSFLAQIILVVLFEIWLLFIKPHEETKYIALQALIALGLGSTSIFFAFEDGSRIIFTVGIYLIAYFSARHFFNAFEESRGRLLSAIFAYFAAALMWVLSHWLLFIGPVAQAAIIIVSTGYSVAGLYYLERNDRLSSLARRQIVFSLFALILLIIIFSDWGDKAV
jgi:hypothetical protein